MENAGALFPSWVSQRSHHWVHDALELLRYMVPGTFALAKQKPFDMASSLPRPLYFRASRPLMKHTHCDCGSDLTPETKVNRETSGGPLELEATATIRACTIRAALGVLRGIVLTLKALLCLQWHTKMAFRRLFSWGGWIVETVRQRRSSLWRTCGQLDRAATFETQHETRQGAMVKRPTATASTRRISGAATITTTSTNAEKTTTTVGSEAGSCRTPKATLLFRFPIQIVTAKALKCRGSKSSPGLVWLGDSISTLDYVVKLVPFTFRQEPAIVFRTTPRRRHHQPATHSHHHQQPSTLHTITTTTITNELTAPTQLRRQFTAMSTNTQYAPAYSPCPLFDEQGEWVWALPDSSHFSPTMTPNHSPDSFISGPHDSTTMPYTPSPLTPLSPEFSDFSTGSNSTPATSPVMNDILDPDLDAFLASYLSSDATQNQFWTGLQDNPATTAASLELCSTLDADLFPVLGFPSVLDTTDLLTPPGPTVRPRPVFPTPAILDAASTFLLPSPPQPQPQQESLHLCPHPACQRTFATRQDLRRHERTHRLSVACPVCPKRQLDNRALARHLWAQHPEKARRLGVPSEVAKCPLPGCKYEGRRDNVKRHMKTHASGPSSGAGRG
ncbi:hypothetical protein VTJ83DRAFT_7576 [Remersonia thermophila]|uniref:C2H2-type domain-containing protein n=1 Tax=Remersonia thermophila TaxID=72144 RepID=A0ABR4D3W9_9PEZI